MAKYLEIVNPDVNVPSTGEGFVYDGKVDIRVGESQRVLAGVKMLRRASLKLVAPKREFPDYPIPCAPHPCG